VQAPRASCRGIVREYRPLSVHKVPIHHPFYNQRVLSGSGLVVPSIHDALVGNSEAAQQSLRCLLPSPHGLLRCTSTRPTDRTATGTARPASQGSPRCLPFCQKTEHRGLSKLHPAIDPRPTSPSTGIAPPSSTLTRSPPAVASNH